MENIQNQNTQINFESPSQTSQSHKAGVTIESGCVKKCDSDTTFKQTETTKRSVKNTEKPANASKKATKKPNYYALLAEDVVKIYNEQRTTTTAGNSTNEDNIVKEIKTEIEEGMQLVKENIEYGLNGDLETLEQVLKLLNSAVIEPHKLTIIDEFDEGYNACGCCDGSNSTGYSVAYDQKPLFTITRVDSETRFPENYTSGLNFYIDLKDDAFNELYYMPSAPGYYETQSNFNSITFEKTPSN